MDHVWRRKGSNLLADNLRQLLFQGIAGLHTVCRQDVAVDAHALDLVVEPAGGCGQSSGAACLAATCLPMLLAGRTTLVCQTDLCATGRSRHAQAEPLLSLREHGQLPYAIHSKEANQKLRCTLLKPTDAHIAMLLGDLAAV